LTDLTSNRLTRTGKARYGSVSAPIGVLRRVQLDPEIYVDENLPQPPPISTDHLIRAARHAPSENRMMVVIALVMLILGGITGLLLEPQWRAGKSTLPPVVIGMVKAIPGLGPWFAASLKVEVAKAEPGSVPVGMRLPKTEEYLPNMLMSLSPEAARKLNETIKIAALANPPAKAFTVPGTDAEYQRRAVQCLTAAVYYEAGNESPQGQAAVAQVVLNRMRHPAFPKSVCGVVFEGSERRTGCQFTFTCDGSLARVPDPVLWRRAQGVAEAALHGAVEPSVGNATHYHANYVVPYWAPKLTKVRVVGSHIFYRWNGGWGSPAAFSGQYAGVEPLVTGVWPVEIDDMPQYAEIPPLPPPPPVTLASLERPSSAPAVPETPAAAVVPVAQPQSAPVAQAPAASPPPQVPPAAPKAKQREPGSRPRLPVPSNW